MTRAGRRTALLLGLCGVLGLLAWLMRADPEAREPRAALAPAPDDLLRPQAEVPPAALPAVEPAAQPVALKAATRASSDAATRIAGRVLRRGDDLPLNDVEILVIADDALLHEPAIVQTLRTRNGAFELSPRLVALRPRTLQFNWSPAVRWPAEEPPAPGDEFSVGDTGRSAGAVVQLDETSGPLDALDVWIDTGWLVRGRVVDSEGRPVPGVQLVEPGQPRDWLGRPETDAQGRFVLGNLDPAKPLVLALEHFNLRVEGSRREIAPAASGDVKELGDLALPYAVPDVLR